MKKLPVVLSIAVILLGGFTSCSKIVDKIFPGVDAKIPDLQLTVPIIPIVPPNEMTFGTFSAHINLDSTIRANTGGVFGIGVVSSIKVKQIVVSITNADDLNNLSNFESGRVVMTSDNNNVPVTLATLSFPDINSSSLTVTPTDSPELINYLKGSEVTYTMYGKARRITTKPLNMNVSVTLRIK